MEWSRISQAIELGRRDIAAAIDLARSTDEPVFIGADGVLVANRAAETAAPQYSLEDFVVGASRPNGVDGRIRLLAPLSASP